MTESEPTNLSPMSDVTVGAVGANVEGVTSAESVSRNGRKGDRAVIIHLDDAANVIV